VIFRVGMRRLLRIIILPVILAAFAGCAYHLKTPVNESQVFSSDPAGANISGEVFVKIKTGEIRKASDATIYLIPVTDYSREWFDHHIVHSQTVTGKDPRSFPSVRAASVDTEGHFLFQHIPAGSYYLTCTVQYQRSNFRLGRMNFGLRTPERSEAYAEITVAPGQKADIIVTRPPA
jgi:hypothetical protein